MLGSKALALKDLLEDENYYARKESTLEAELGLDRLELLQVICELASPHDRINLFEFEGERYVGFESRKVWYARDAAEGKNRFEQ